MGAVEEGGEGFWGNGNCLCKGFGVRIRWGLEGEGRSEEF